MKAKIDNTQQNTLCRLSEDSDEIVDFIISEFWKLTQKEHKSKHDRVEKKIPRELCKRLEFDHTTKWYTHTQETGLENGTHKILS